MKQLVDVYPTRKSSEPALLERKDPVVYQSTLNQSEIGTDELSFYEQNGYLFLESFFQEEEVEEFKQETKRLLTESRGADRPEVILEPEGEEVRSVFAVHKDDVFFQKLANSPRLIAIVKQILGSDVYIHQSRINFKPGFTGKEFYWHSDFETWHAEDGMPRMRALSCSIALEDNNVYNGALMIIPGSHKWFVSCVGETPEDHFKDSLRRQEYGVPDQESLTKLVQQGGINMPTGKAGSVLLFDCNVMHGSSANISPYPRSNAFFVYNSVENKLEDPFASQKPRPDYIATR
ncbi:ectoine hydroxylase [Paenibacillus camelliae]|uniref:ectoine hydroxylase n=1 Tax=Paenibacillus camelliae TaxID=512410 RepID=UPI002041EF66|nr:ectoine hydroxylase [Paenibacillus camelliae]MCM3634708.1 ectoine hydroxylase [Paenibacillus camelliae]